MILCGTTLAKLIETSLQKRVAIVKETMGRVPLLVTIQVGDDPASTTYVSMKARACERIGMQSKQYYFSDASQQTTATVITLIEQLSLNKAVDGILLQHPVPPHIDERACFDAIAIAKDVDGVTTAGFGKLSMGQEAFASATAAGIIALLDHYGVTLAGKHAVVIGRSPILGKPVAAMLLNKDATVTICHSKTVDLPAIVKQADIVIGAVGKAHFIKGAWIKNAAVVIDAGYHPEKKIGDIDLEEHDKARLQAYTPVPGGVGPMTITKLIQQTVEAAEKKC